MTTANKGVYVTLILLMSASLLLTFIPAYAHDGHDDHDDTTQLQTTVTYSPTVNVSSVVQKQELLKLLQQLVVLLTQMKELSDDDHDDHADEESHSDELQVWVEIHSNKTHVHIIEPGEDEVSFLLEDLEYTEEEEIIAAIAEETGLSEHDIEEVIVFPSGEVDEHGDSTDAYHDEDEHDESGIHIMSDGTIMWGNGEEVEGATITADGDIRLSDGRVIPPAFDLR